MTRVSVDRDALERVLDALWELEKMDSQCICAVCGEHWKHSDDCPTVPLRATLAQPEPVRGAEAGGGDEGMGQVGELLAVIHSDGGHYLQEHGLEKAARDAIRQYYLKLHGQDVAVPFLEQLAQPEPVREEVERLRVRFNHAVYRLAVRAGNLQREGNAEWAIWSKAADMAAEEYAAALASGPEGEG